MTVNGVEVYIDANFGRRNGKRKTLRALDTIKEQDFDSVEECISLIKGFVNAIEVGYTMDEVEEWTR